MKKTVNLRKSGNIYQHINLPANQAIIDKMVLICSNDQHILGNPIRNRFQVMLPYMLHAALEVCSSAICLNRPSFLLRSSFGLPSSATFPSARTTILSAASTVRIR